MRFNKKAIYALAAYYDAVGLKSVATKAERVDLVEMFIPCIQTAFIEETIENNFLHAEKYFKPWTAYHVAPEEEAYTKKLNDANIAKLLRYIARKGMFPGHRSLKYV